MDGITRKITLEAQTSLPTEFGTFVVKIYRAASGDTSIAIVSGHTEGREDLPVRVHSACFTGEVLGSMKCDCKQQLDFGLQYIAEHGGVVLYLPQEGRGIGLGNKIRAYALQELGHDTIQANTLLGLPVDARTYDDAADIINDLGIGSIRLLTNNPLKMSALTDLGIQVNGRIPVAALANEHSAGYLRTKRERMGHFLNGVRSDDGPSLNGAAMEQPFVHINFALDAKGQTTAPDGAQTSISCNTDWRRVHQLREKYAAVAVGANTWNSDQPQLTARAEKLGREPARQPDRVIFAGHQHCPVTPARRRTFVVGTVGSAPNAPAHVIHATDHELTWPLQKLYRQRVDSLLVEGGLTLVRSFIQQGIANLITIYVKTTSVETAASAVRRALPGLPPDSLNAQPLGQGVLLSAVHPPFNFAGSQLTGQALHNLAAAHD